MITGLKSQFNTISVAQEFARVMQAGAGPAFELQFFQTQDAVLGRLDKEIAELQNAKNTSGATAVLELSLSSVNRDIGALTEYRDRTISNRKTGDAILTEIVDLVALADSSTVAEFDAALAVLIEDIEKLQTPLFEQFGAPDGLRKVKEQALDVLNNINHNNFATAGDVIAVQGALNDLTPDIDVALSITRINEESAIKLVSSAIQKTVDIETKINDIQIDAKAEQVEEIKKTRERFAAILTAISLSFEIPRTWSVSSTTALFSPANPRPARFSTCSPENRAPSAVFS